ncbi:hypothetical protein GCM10007304_02340 [Rhodococcoides trifolii]|uniref:DUF6194 domain-containing protein n=1 Tax=Rhodococcoides trifolii TaxID=908250 RepID=A0A917CP91_9NOCA|nr:DUF6194 family protein [Rhodococcus trifolii]GGF91901.1 hypothetical protein GCM10007304_02340 [Rhodococcus trifolii]
MTVDDIVALVEKLDGTLTQRPSEGDGSPELAWGDLFFYYSPDHTLPSRTQPFATIITKNYPADDRSHLDRPGAFRVNIAASKDQSRSLADASADDVLAVHPTYGAAGWVCVVNPGPDTEADVRDLLVSAYSVAKARHERR